MAKSKLVKANEKIAEKGSGCVSKGRGYRSGRVSKVERYGSRHIYQNRGQIVDQYLTKEGERNRRAGKAKAKGRKQERERKNGGRNKHPAAVFVADRGV